QVATRAYSVTVTSALSITTVLVPDGVVGSPYNATIASAGGSGAHSWSISEGSLPPGVQLNPSTGSVVSLTGTPDTAGTYRFVVRVAASQQVATRAYSVTVTSALSITTVLVPDGVVGSPYNATIASAGGSGTHSWSISEGSLPPGLQLGASAGPTVNLTGTPSLAGPYSFVVRVASGQQAATRSYSISVTTTLSITRPVLPDGVVGSPYNAAINSAGGSGLHSWSLASGALPPGVQLAPSTGPSVALAGTPTASGSFSFRLQVNSAGATAARDLSITVTGTQLTIGPQTLPDAVRGTPYIASVTAEGGTGPYLWAIQAGSLPPGIALAGTGLSVALSGTPTTAGPFVFQIRVTGANGESAVRELSIRVNAPLPPQMTIAPPSLPSGTVNSVYAAALAVTGGTAPYAWSLTAGVLPPGIALGSTGSAAQLTGTPSAAGNFVFTIRVNDSTNQTATHEYSVTVSSGTLRILTTALPNGARQSFYASTRIDVSGGLTPYLFAVTSGLLPAGLTLDGTSGTVSGTPLATGTSTFAVTVTDSRGTSDSRIFSIVVTETITTLPPAMVGSDYAQRITPSTGSAPFQCSLTAGRVPPGLALSTECDLRGRPTDPGSGSMTIEIRDRFGRPQAATYLMNIVAALSLRPDTLESAVAGRDYSATLQAAGGFPPLALSVEGLPAGLSFSPQTGVLSGRVQAGSYPFRATVTDSASNRLVRDYTLVASAGLTLTSTSPLPDGELDRDYLFTLTAAGGISPYTFVAEGSLPAGLTLEPAGRLLGRPSSPGGLSFSVRVSDAAGATARGVFAFFVPMPAGTQETPYSLRLLPPSGNFGAGCQLVSGALPAGVQLNSGACSLSNAPSAAGSFEFAVRFGGAQTADIRQAGVIQPALRLRPGSLSAGIVSVPYSVQFAGDGALRPYSFRVTAGELPSGLALDLTTGVLSGTPSAAGTFRFSVTLTDSNARFPASVTTAYSLSLTPPVLSSVRINGLADAVDPLGQPRLSVEIGDPYALPITGRLQLTFTSNADNPSDDPFVSFSNGSRSMAFSVLADRTAATFAIPVPAVQAGTTAGDIRIAASLETGGVTITPNPAPERIIHIARAAPQISQLEVTRTAGRLTIRMTGFATPRSVRSARFRFTAGAGVTLQTSEFSLPVIDLFNGWYQNRQSTQFGSQFTFTQVFDVQGDAAQIRTVEVTLSNTEGESRSVRREI
ncbi:MAG: putative Ig domain-containing protein, partial [Bryobacteraceae bacterium]